MSEDVITEFLIECHENLDRLDVDLVELEKDPHNGSRLASAFRTVHTIKGSAAFLAFQRLEAIAHAGEHLLSRMRDGQVVLTQEVATGLLRLVDAMRQILAHVETTRQEPDIEWVEVTEELERLSGWSGASAEHSSPAHAREHASATSVSSASATDTATVSAGANQSTSVAGDAGQPRDRRRNDRRSGDDRRGVTDSSLRVDVGLLDKLMNLVGELVLARNQILQFSPAQTDSSLGGATQRLNLVTSELQEGVTKTRMQPIGTIWSKLPRVVRDVATQCGKQVRLDLKGQETDLDKTIIEAIRDPLTHLVRNAVDHGIEAPAVRRQRGKLAEGQITLSAYHEGGRVNIAISDDGAGIDAANIRAAAIRAGVVTADRAGRMTDQEAVRLIFEPGFSTAEAVSTISGRGVGMDVVRTNIERIGGQIDFESRVGEGTVFRIKIPLTLAIIPALVIGTDDGARYAIPQVNVLELVRLERDAAVPVIERIKDVSFYRLRGHLLPLIDLQHELALAPAAGAAGEATNIVVLNADEKRFGLVVDQILDTAEIVVKPLGKQLKTVTTFAGATIMGDGTVALILDVLGLARRARVVSELGRRRRGPIETPSAEPMPATDRQTLLLFRAGEHKRMAIPLSQIARLEELSVDAVEHIGTLEVVQYRGDILPLVCPWSSPGRRDASGAQSLPAILVHHGDGQIALVVDEIVDVVTERVELRRSLSRPGVVGSAVIQQHVTDLIDVPALLLAVEQTFAGTRLQSGQR